MTELMNAISLLHITLRPHTYYCMNWSWSVWCDNTVYLCSHRWHGKSDHWGRDKFAAILLMTFSNATFGMTLIVFRFKFYWILFSRAQLPIFQHRFRWWLCADQATSLYLKQGWPSLVYWRTYGYTRPWWVNVLAFYIFIFFKEICILYYSSTFF